MEASARTLMKFKCYGDNLNSKSILLINCCTVGSCRLKFIYRRTMLSIWKSWLTEYIPSQNYTYFYDYIVQISLYLQLMNKQVTPKSWKLVLLNVSPLWINIQSISCTHMCIVSDLTRNLPPTFTSHFTSILRMSEVISMLPALFMRWLILLLKIRSTSVM